MVFIGPATLGFHLLDGKAEKGDEVLVLVEKESGPYIMPELSILGVIGYKQKVAS